MLVNPQQYHGEISASYNRSTKYTFVQDTYKFNNKLIFLLSRIFICLAFNIIEILLELLRTALVLYENS